MVDSGAATDVVFAALRGVLLGRLALCTIRIIFVTVLLLFVFNDLPGRNFSGVHSLYLCAVSTGRHRTTEWPKN